MCVTTRTPDILSQIINEEILSVWDQRERVAEIFFWTMWLTEDKSMLLTKVLFVFF